MFVPTEISPTETRRAVGEKEALLHRVRRLRATIFALLFVGTVPLGVPLWIAGGALLVGVGLDLGFWWSRSRGKGRLSLELANAALDLLPAMVFMLDRRGTLQYVNARFANLIGPDRGGVPEDLHGSQFHRFFEGRDQQEVIIAVTRALTRGASTVEAEVPTEGGQRIPMVLTALRVKVGGTSHVIGVGQDITAQKEAEAKLRRQERRYRLLAENVTDIVIHLDPATRLLYVSPSVRDMLGYRPEELAGRRALDLVHPEDRRRGKQVVQEALKEGRPHRTELRVQTKDNEYLWVESVGKELEGTGSGRELVVSARDISKRKAREEELNTVEAARQEAERARAEAERASRLKSSFLANMSHEIRTPLTSIIGFAEAIGEEVQALEKGMEESPDEAPGEPLREQLEGGDFGALSRFASLIEKGGHRLLETLNGVLNLSKLEAGEMELSPTPVNLVEEVKEAAAFFKPQAEEGGLDLHAEVDGRPVWAKIDRDGLHIVLRNLVTNAIKYTEEGGQVWIRARQEDEAAVLEVEDTGIGMDPEEVPGLFDAFRQESEGLAREYEGSGLGLAVTSQAVQQMGGTIEVETEKEEGSCFVIWLPRPEGAHEAEDPSRQEDASGLNEAPGLEEASDWKEVNQDGET